MKDHPRIDAGAKRSDAARSRQDLRAWCMKLGCTEAELRETVRAVMWLMAGPHWRQRHH